MSDPKWKELKGGYGVHYDAAPALLRLERGEDTWAELWRELHHQGAVAEASYAALPHLVRIAKASTRRDWNLYALTSTIEVERHRRGNPPLPDWLADAYRLAWQELFQLAVADLRRVDDTLVLRSILGAIALAKGDLKLGAVISQSDESEITAFLDERDAWSENYR
ncbi:MAG: hypothetical protein ACREX4_20210 [Gammaproteobacteria bacterium]